MNYAERPTTAVRLAMPVAILPGMALRAAPFTEVAAVPAYAGTRDTAFVIGIAVNPSPHGALAVPRFTVVVDGVVELTTDEWDAVTGDLGGLMPGATYFLSDQAEGKIARKPGRWRTEVGLAITATKMMLQGFDGPRLNLENRIVESVWVRDDGSALALVFDDGDQQLFETYAPAGSAVVIDTFQLSGDPESWIGTVQIRIEHVVDREIGHLPVGSIKGPLRHFTADGVFSIGSREYSAVVSGTTDARFIARFDNRGPLSMQPDETWVEQ